MNSKLAKIFLVVSCSLAFPSCIVAYKESQARKQGQTGDPNSGGYYGYSQELADQKTASMRRDLKSAEASRDARYAQVSRLRSQLASVRAQMAKTRDAKVLAALKAKENEISKQILAGSESL